MDWKALEAALFGAGKAVLERLFADGVERVYGAAFYASFREKESVIHLPSFGANTQAALEEDHPYKNGQGYSSIKWNPPDWRWQVALDTPDEPCCAPLLELHASLQAYANRAGPEQWAVAEARFVNSVARAAAALGKHFAKHPHVAIDFIVFFHDEDGGPELARKSMSARLFVHHFPEQDATQQMRLQVAALPPAEQATFYIKRLSSFDGIDCEEADAWLIAHAALALPGLMDKLASGRDRWRAAKIIGLGGVADPQAIALLRRQLLDGKDLPTRNWCASALGYLGDFAWLLSLAASPATVDFAVQGCCANLRAFRERGAQPVVLDYTPLERVLVLAPDSAAKAEDVIRLGSSFCGIGKADIAEALRGLGSPHLSIRQHAVCILNNRRLGKKEFQRILAALRPCLEDPDQKVRYLAKLSIEGLSI